MRMLRALQQLLLRRVSRIGLLVALMTRIIVRLIMKDVHLTFQEPLLFCVVLCQVEHGIAHLTLEALTVFLQGINIDEDVTLFAIFLVHFVHELINYIVLPV